MHTDSLRGHGLQGIEDYFFKMLTILNEFNLKISFRFSLGANITRNSTYSSRYRGKLRDVLIQFFPLTKRQKPGGLKSAC